MEKRRERERERNESDRTKGRGLGACVPTQQYGEFREAAQYPPDRQLIDILPHTRHVIRAVTESDTHVMHRADRYYVCDFTPRCRAFFGDRCPVSSRISVTTCPSSSLLSLSSPSPTSSKDELRRRALFDGAAAASPVAGTSNVTTPDIAIQASQIESRVLLFSSCADSSPIFHIAGMW